MLQYNPDSEKTQTKPFLPESDLPAQHGGAGKGETMVKNSKSIALLVLMIVLLVLISSRMAPRQAQRPGVPTVTDDPIPAETPPEAEVMPDSTVKCPKCGARFRVGRRIAA